MSIEQTYAKISASIWQAIAQSDVDLSKIPSDQQEKLVAKIADQLILTLDQLLDELDSDQRKEAQEKIEAVQAGIDEEILWRGRPFLSLIDNYMITTERIKVVHGLLGKDIENFELIRIQDLDMDRGITERMLNLGDLTIRGQDSSQSTIVLRNISDPEAVYELLRKAWLEARKRHGLQFREYM